MTAAGTPWPGGSPGHIFAPVIPQDERLAAALAGRYRLERPLGQGGMATVHLAEDLKHHRKVAVKVLRPQLALALGGERFLREIEIAAALNHPHILAVHDSGEAAGLLYYIMPYVEGESLRVRLERDRRLPLDEALQITQGSGGRAGLRAPLRADPSRHQAGEHPASGGPCRRG